MNTEEDNFFFKMNRLSQTIAAKNIAPLCKIFILRFTMNQIPVKTEKTRFSE